MTGRLHHTDVRATTRLVVCFGSGDELEECLRRTASVHCHDCRDSHAPVRAALVERCDARLFEEAA